MTIQLEIKKVCPFLIRSHFQNRCGCYPTSLMCPSIEEMKNYCLGSFDGCPYFRRCQHRIGRASDGFVFEREFD